MAETALGLLVVVTVLLFGIHFAELGYTTLKVQEAAVAALWDSTQGETHTMPGALSAPLGEFDVTDTVNAAEADAQARYQDFDGRSSVTRGTTITQSLTTATGLTVDCNENAPEFNLLGAILVGGVLRDDGGASCTAQATIDAVRIPRAFQEGGGGFFDSAHRGFAAAMRVCAVGRAWGGNCGGRFTLMLDDWGFSHGQESATAPMIPNPWFAAPSLTNPQYWTSVNILYQQTQLLAGVPTGAAGDMATQVVGESPLGSNMFTSEDAFWMSFTGGATGHFQLLWPLPNDSLPAFGWPTTPGPLTTLPGPPQYMAGAMSRDECFLGKACD